MSARRASQPDSTPRGPPTGGAGSSPPAPPSAPTAGVQPPPPSGPPLPPSDTSSIINNPLLLLAAEAPSAPPPSPLSEEAQPAPAVVAEAGNSGTMLPSELPNEAPSAPPLPPTEQGHEAGLGGEEGASGMDVEAGGGGVWLPALNHIPGEGETRRP